MPYTPPERYRHTNPITIRFADMDAMGHVNNALYLTYFETARMNYMHDVCGVGAVQHNGGMHGLGDIRGASMILAKMTVEYKLPLVLGDEIVVYIRCSHIGNKSFELDAVIMRYKDGKTEPAATGVAVLVAYDYATSQTQPVPELWRERIRAYEPLPV
jgi:acyl-CoA thioester hydrolase